MDDMRDNEIAEIRTRLLSLMGNDHISDEYKITILREVLCAIEEYESAGACDG